MTARFKIFIFILIPFLLGSQPANGQQVRRHVLALYDSKAGETPKENHVHMNAEVILNHLGCVVDYHDLQSGLPDDGSMQKYRGVLTWFYRNEMDAPVAYLGHSTGASWPPFCHPWQHRRFYGPANRKIPQNC